MFITSVCLNAKPPKELIKRHIILKFSSQYQNIDSIAMLLRHIWCHIKSLYIINKSYEYEISKQPIFEKITYWYFRAMKTTNVPVFVFHTFYRTCFSKVRYGRPVFRPSVCPSVFPSTIHVDPSI